MDLDKLSITSVAAAKRKEDFIRRGLPEAYFGPKASLLHKAIEARAPVILQLQYPMGFGILS